MKNRSGFGRFSRSRFFQCRVDYGAASPELQQDGRLKVETVASKLAGAFAEVQSEADKKAEVKNEAKTEDAAEKATEAAKENAAEADKGNAGAAEKKE